jgi:hypothetical protein
MNVRCENCGQPALGTDVNCWHCGQPFPGRDEEKVYKPKVKAGWQHELSLSAIGAYAGLTLLVIVITWFLTNSLGKQPLVQTRFGTRPASGWELLTASDQQFTVMLPKTWEWADGSSPGDAARISRMLADDRLYRAGTYPAGTEVDDLVFLFVAQGPERVGEEIAPFFFVSKSKKLNSLSYLEALEYYRNGQHQVSSANMVTDYDRTHLSIIVRPPLNDRPGGGDGPSELYCRQQLIQADSDSLLVAACSAHGRRNAYESIFNDMLGSFQRLIP